MHQFSLQCNQLLQLSFLRSIEDFKSSHGRRLYGGTRHTQQIRISGMCSLVYFYSVEKKAVQILGLFYFRVASSCRSTNDSYPSVLPWFQRYIHIPKLKRCCTQLRFVANSTCSVQSSTSANMLKQHLLNLHSTTRASPRRHTLCVLDNLPPFMYMFPTTSHRFTKLGSLCSL